MNLPGVVVISEHRVELDASVEQLLVGLLELQTIVFRRHRPFVDVVAGHQHEAVIKPPAVGLHLCGNGVLLRRSASAVPNHGELDGHFVVWQRQRVRRNSSSC